MRCELVAGRSDARGLAGIYDPAGLDRGWVEPRLEAVLGKDARLLGAEGGDDVTGVLLEGELLNAEGVGGDDLAVTFGRRGAKMLGPLRGLFALVAWDARRRQGLIAVDQLGGRSLYFAEKGSRLVFASEVCLLLGLLPRRPNPNEVAVANWLGNGGQPLGATLYEGVLQLPAGHLIELGDGWTTRTWWSPSYEAPLPLTRPEAADRLWRELVRSVRRRTSNSSPIGMLMSGGVDSSAVAAAATEAVQASQPLRGYSAVFPGHPHPRVDESERITQLTGALEMPSVQVQIEPGGALALSLEYLEAWELPLPGAGYLLERPLLELAAADGAAVVLDGQGGDELFGLSGYLLADRLRHGRIASSVRLAQSYPGLRGDRRRAGAAWRYYALHGAAPYAVHNALRRARGGKRHAPGFLTPRSSRLYLEAADPWAWKRTEDVPRWWAYKADAITNDRGRAGLGEYLRRRAALAGLKVRPPLLDVDLVELALRIPPELEFDPDVDRPLIRDALRGRVPDAVRLSTLKSNLAPFYFDDIAGPDLEPIRGILRAPDAEVGAYTQLDVVRSLVNEPPRAGGPNWMGWMSTVWRLVTVECWLRHQGDRGFAPGVRDAGLPQPVWTVLRSSPAGTTSYVFHP